MAVEVREQPPAALAEYAAIPVSFDVGSQLRVGWVQGGLGGIKLPEELVDPPYLKDYDAAGASPLDWAKRWDVSSWGVILARDATEAVGGAVVACRTPGPYLLDERDDLAALVDLRVKPQRRREGIGRRLFACAARWARDRNCRELKIETQNINVAACRLYAACGCRLCGVHPGAYAGFPNEVSLLWYLQLGT